MCLARPDLFLARYAPMVLDILQKAIDSAVITPHSEEDFVEYIVALREGILYVFSCLLDELNARGQLDLIEAQCQLIFTLITRISDDVAHYNNQFGDEIFYQEMHDAVGIVGDVAKHLKLAITFVFNEKVTALVDRFSEVAQANPHQDKFKKTADYAKDRRAACR